MLELGEKRERVPLTLTITLPREQWLTLDLETIILVFSLSIKTSARLRRMEVENLGDLILFSKKELLKGENISIAGFNAIGYHGQKRIEYLEKKRGGPILAPRSKIAPSSMRELEGVFARLNVTFREE